MNRFMNLICVSIGAGMMACTAWGQLFLVTGSQSPKSPQGSASVLLEVGHGGEVVQVGDIAPQSAGTWFIDISYDDRKVVAFSPGNGADLKAQNVVVDFDKAAVVKRCPLPKNLVGYVAIAEWMAEVQAKGLSMLEQSVASDPVANKGVITAMSLNPSVGCESSYEIIAPADIKSIVTNGRAGVADLAVNEGVPFAMDRDGKIIKRFAGGDIAYLGYQVPSEFLAGLDRPSFSVMINNSVVLAVVVGGVAPDKSYRLLIFRKRDQTWHSVPNPSDGYPAARSFEHYLSLSEAHVKSAEYPESAGRGEWRKASGKMGPSISASLLESNLVYPGRLHLYDLDSEKVYTIETKQGDSEVLLVEDGTVYYRVSDRLYSAHIATSGVSGGRLLTTNEAIRDAHWAFIKH
jgi:hypothetical protein